MTDPKFKIGQEVNWKGSKYVIQGVRNYQDYCWVYDFFPTRDTVVPFHFTGIAEHELYTAPIKRWWQKLWELISQRGK